MSRGFESHTLRDGAFRRSGGPIFGVLPYIRLLRADWRGLSVPGARWLLAFFLCRAASSVPLAGRIARPDLDGCWCDKTPTVSVRDQLSVRQKYTYGTSQWLAYYGMHNASEAKMANLKRTHGTMRRASSTVKGTTANAFLFAVPCAAINIALLDAIYEGSVTLSTTEPRDVPITNPRTRRSTPTHLRTGTKARPPRRSRRQSAPRQDRQTVEPRADATWNSR